MTTKSVVTVTVQLICIGVLVFSGPVIPGYLPAFILVCVGVVVIGWAITVLGFHNLRIEPEVSQHARLVTSGPYRFIRHPMYTGGTLITLAWLWNEFSVPRLAVWLVLIADFLVKLRYEEGLLSARFPEYRTYMQRTKRLVPFVY